MIIVTGGAGFIGSALVWKLNEREVKDILIVDELYNLAQEKKHNLESLTYIDVMDKDEFLKKFLLKNISSIQTIFHMGACSDTTESNREYLMTTNYEYTKEIASLCLENNIQLIYASSAATYGNGSKGFDDAHDKLTQCEPLNMYGHSKQLFDLWVQQNGLLDRLTGLKYFNVYGPNEYHKGEMRSFVIKAFEQISSTGKVRLFKSYRSDYRDGEQKRDFIYIKDAVDMTLFFYDNKDIKGIYNIGTGQARTWNDLVKAVFAAMEKEEAIEYIDMPPNIKDQYQYYTCANMDKFSSINQDFSAMSLEQGVQDYVKNYLSSHKHLGIK